MSNSRITPKQIRAALGLLDWEYRDLANASGLTVDTLSRLCLGKNNPTETTLDLIRASFEASGVEFLQHNGVRERQEEVEFFTGPARFADFTAFLHDYLERNGGELCISVTDERMLQKNYPNIDTYRAKMKALAEQGCIKGRILAAEGNFTKTWSELRRQVNGAHMPQASFYIFGDNLALISFEHDPSPYVVLHKASPFAAVYRASFNAAWALGEVL